MASLLLRTGGRVAVRAAQRAAQLRRGMNVRSRSLCPD